MRCLSIRQPWAWLICAGKKTIENRVWRTAYRGTIAVHASTTKSEVGRLKKALESAAFQADDFEYGAIIGLADLVDIQPYAREHEEDGFASGPYCFRLANGRFLKEPVPIMGKLNLFVLEEGIAAELEHAETYTVDLSADTPETKIANAFEFEADVVGRYLEAIQELTGKIDNQQLADMCSRVIELEPEIGDGYLARVIAGPELGIDDNLKSDTNTLLRLWPDDADAMAYGSDAYMVLEEFERAKTLLDRLIEQNPEVYGSLIQHGRALFELGEIQRAKAELELAIEKLAGDDHCVSMCQINLARIAEREPAIARSRALAGELASSQLEVVKQLALRSAEVNAINNLLNAGGKLENCQTSPFIVPDFGTTNAAFERALQPQAKQHSQSRTSTAPKTTTSWWKLW